MTKTVETSVVEGVGNREQGNIQTHGESKKVVRGAQKGHISMEKTHTQLRVEIN